MKENAYHECFSVTMTATELAAFNKEVKRHLEQMLDELMQPLGEREARIIRQEKN